LRYVHVGIRAAAVVLAGLLVGCEITLDRSEEAAAAVREQDLSGLPYHPLVHHLDLSILAYHLYGQSLVWPFDPYYEDVGSDDERAAFMDVVRDWAARRGDAQVEAGAGLDAYRGPGSLSGFDDNDSHDPILYQYSRLHPWSTSVTNAAGTWVEYLTPPEITSPIRDVSVCTRPTGGAEGDVVVHQLTPAQEDWATGAEDTLLVFEGGTGDKGEQGQPSSQSLMGFALLRARPTDGYDVHISFRGSRSGSTIRAALDAFSENDAAGNPDWITDLGYDTIDAPWIATTGQVSRGMAHAVQTLLPQLFGCLDDAAQTRDAPSNIFVTGHSLGGGLAQHFVSAIMMGNSYGPGGDAMPDSLADWPWTRAKLITISAPRVGDEEWAEALTTDHLGMDFFGADTTYDTRAIGVTDLDVIPRLTDPDQAAAYRVLIPTDPITTAFLAEGKHVGKTVYVALPSETAPSDADDHEPEFVRDFMTSTLRDSARIPAVAWRYRAMEELNPSRDADAAGSVEEYQKLAEATRAYYADSDQYFDLAAFDEGFETLLELLD
jgi:hypothetical protein